MQNLLKAFFSPLDGIISWQGILTPISVVKIKVNYSFDSYIGYTNLYIFGIRVVSWQSTNPW